MTHVWLAQYCSCHYESAFETLYVCRTRRIANTLLKSHKTAELKRRSHSMYKGKRPWEHWRVLKMDILTN